MTFKSDKDDRVRCADCKWLGREHTCWVCTNPSCTALSIVSLQRMSRRVVLAPRVCFSFSSAETSIPVLSADDVRLLHRAMTNTELIRQEIQRRCEEINSIAGDHYNELQCGQMHAYGSLRAFIDKLSKETLQGREYTIPEGMEATIENGKIILRKRESEDERIINDLKDFLRDIANGTNRSMPSAEQCQTWLAFLEKQKEQIPYIDFVIKPLTD